MKKGHPPLQPGYKTDTPDYWTRVYLCPKCGYEKLVGDKYP
jgi:hypothetical protein